MTSIARLERSDLPPHHRMLTLGHEHAGIRITMGKLDRHGRYHPNRPCIFILWKNRRIG